MIFNYLKKKSKLNVRRPYEHLLFYRNQGYNLFSSCYSLGLADGGPFGGSCQIHGPINVPQSESEDLTMSAPEEHDIKSPVLHNPAFSHSRCPPEIHKSCFCVRFIAEHTKMLEDSTKVSYVLIRNYLIKQFYCFIILRSDYMILDLY